MDHEDAQRDVHMADIRNMWCDRGDLVKRAGWRNWNSTEVGSAKLDRGFFWRGSFYVAQAGSIYKSRGSTFSKIINFLSPVGDPFFEVFETGAIGALYIATGKEPIVRTDGINVQQLPGTVAIGKKVMAADDKLLVYDFPDNGVRCRFSGAGNPISFDDDDYIDFVDQFGNSATRIVQYGGAKLVVKPYGTGIMTGTGPYSYHAYWPGSGSISPHSFAYDSQTQAWLYLGTNGGIYEYRGGPPQEISNKKIRHIVAGIDPMHKESATAVFKNGRYYLSYLSTRQKYSTNSRVLIFDVVTREFIGNDDDLQITGWIDDPADPQLYATSATDGYIKVMYNGYSDNGSAIGCHATTKFLIQNPIEEEKRYFWAYIHYRALSAESFTVDYMLNYDPAKTAKTVTQESDGLWGTGKWGTMKWGGGGRKEAKMRFADSDEWAKSIALRFSESSSYPLHLYRCDLAYQLRGAN